MRRKKGYFFANNCGLGFGNGGIYYPGYIHRCGIYGGLESIKFLLAA